MLRPQLSLRREIFLEAVKQAAISGVIEPTYDSLPDAVKREYSFTTFERLIEQDCDHYAD